MKDATKRKRGAAVGSSALLDLVWSRKRRIGQLKHNLRMAPWRLLHAITLGMLRGVVEPGMPIRLGSSNSHRAGNAGTQCCPPSIPHHQSEGYRRDGEEHQPAMAPAARLVSGDKWLGGGSCDNGDGSNDPDQRPGAKTQD